MAAAAGSVSAQTSACRHRDRGARRWDAGKARRNGHFALSTSSGAGLAKRRLFVGDRAVVRRAASIQALELLRRHLAGEEA